jgi:hypothetical protein
MPLSLKESQAIAELAEFLYDFLPGSGHALWKGHVSYRTVAEKVGVGSFWQPGSKSPVINALLRRTLEHQRSLFESLILEIVQASIPYRKKSGNPLAPDDVDTLNGFLLEVGFKFPFLWDPKFRESLRADKGTLIKQKVEMMKEQQQEATNQAQRSACLLDLKQQLFTLHGESNRQAAGFALEKILNELFSVYRLAPRASFRVLGEQIDGSFELDNETYLLEAKWKKDGLSEADLLVFRGKVEGKSAYTRGVFVGLNGITDEANDALTRGKQPTFFVVNGYDLSMVLSEVVSLVDFLRQRRRLLAEEGLVVIPFQNIWDGSRSRLARGA